MSEHDVALLVHLVGAIAFFSGMAVAGAAQGAAARRRRPGEVAAVLGVARAGVALVAGGLVLVVASGAWLLSITGRDLGERWLVAALALLTASAILGAAGGQAPKRARRLAERHAGEAEPPPELARLLGDRRALAANALAALAAVGVLALMVWRPGG